MNIHTRFLAIALATAVFPARPETTLTWNGGPDGTWDAASENWLDAAGSPAAWTDGATASFEADAAPALSGAKHPASLRTSAGSLAFSGDPLTVSAVSYRASGSISIANDAALGTAFSQTLSMESPHGMELATETLLFPGRTLSELTSVAATIASKFGGNPVATKTIAGDLGGSAGGDGLYNVRKGEGSLSFEVQWKESGYLSLLKLSLRDGSAGIFGTLEAAKYRPYDDYGVAWDENTGKHTEDIGYHPTDPTQAASGTEKASLLRLEGSFAGSADAVRTTFSGPVSLSAPVGIPYDESFANAVLLFPARSVSDIVGASADIGWKWGANPLKHQTIETPYAADAATKGDGLYNIHNDGTTFRCDIEWKAYGYLQGIRLELRQVGNDIWGCVPDARYMYGNDYGQDIATGNINNLGYYVNDDLSSYILPHGRTTATIIVSLRDVSLAFSDGTAERAALAGTLAVGAGTVAFEGPVSLPAAVDLGGCVAWGRSATLAGTPKLHLVADAAMDFAAGAAVAFADSSAIPWADGATLDVTGDIGSRSLRFGTDANGLNAAQLACISVGGKFGRAALDADGYLVPPASQTLVLLR